MCLEMRKWKSQTKNYKADSLYVKQRGVQLKQVESLIIQVPLSELFLPVRVAIVVAAPLRHLLLLGFLEVCEKLNKKRGNET